MRCPRCNIDKDESLFGKSSARKTGRQFYCKKCQAEKNLERYHEKLSGCPNYKKKKADYDKERRRLYGDKLRAYDKERSKEPHRKAAHNEETRKRRARLRNAVPENYDRDGVIAIYKLAQKLTEITGVSMHVDHIVPISKGGRHDVDNLQILAAPLNLAKGSKIV